MQARGRRAIHVLRNFAQNLPLLHRLSGLHLDRTRVHVEVIVVRAVLAFQLNRRVLGHIGDDAIDDGDCLPRVVLEGRWSDILALMASTGRAKGHRPAAHFAIVVALLHGIVIAAIAFAATGRTLAAPPTAAITPDLRIHVRETAVFQLQWENDVGQVDEPITRATSASVLFKQIARRVVGKWWLGRLRCGPGRRCG